MPPNIPKGVFFVTILFDNDLAQVFTWTSPDLMAFSMSPNIFHTRCGAWASRRVSGLYGVEGSGLREEFLPPQQNSNFALLVLR